MLTKNIVKKALLKRAKDQIKKLEMQDLYSVFSSKYFKQRFEETETARGLVVLYNYAKKCDDMYPVFRGVGQKLEELLSDKNQVVAISENTSDGLQSDAVRRTLTSGIPMHYSQIRNENLTGDGKLKFADNMLDIMYLLKITKNGKFVLSFPKDLVDKKGNYHGYDFCELFNTDDENIYIKPKYVDSYINFGKEGLNRRNKNSLEEILVQK